MLMSSRCLLPVVPALRLPPHNARLVMRPLPSFLTWKVPLITRPRGFSVRSPGAASSAAHTYWSNSLVKTFAFDEHYV